MKRRNPFHQKRRLRVFLLLALLAVLCIAGAELAASSFFAPALYEKITAPVRNGIQAAADFGGRMAADVSAWWSELTAPEEELAENEIQVAAEPVISPQAPISDPSVTELKESHGKEVLTGGTTVVVYYNQGDEAWADQPYGSDDIGSYGCGPTALAMAVSSMTGQDVDPAQMAQWAVERGYWAKRSGSYLSIVQGAAAEYGLTAGPIRERTPQAVREALLAGDLLVALMGPGHFTDGGHFILVRGVTLSGSLLVADPNSLERSLMEWDAQVILDELSTSTSSGAPLWVLSKSDF